MAHETIYPGPEGVDPGQVLQDMKKIERQFLPERVERQIIQFIDLLQAYNDKLPPERQRSEADYRFLRHFYPSFVVDRNHRADEVNSPEYREVVEKAHETLPMTTYSVMCMDGRVKMIHAFGFSADIGSAIREPGGLLTDFNRGKDGKLKLEPDSNFAEQIADALEEHEFLAEVFDSHYGCAARKGEEKSRGKSPEDDGLFSDVLHKKEMVAATQRYVVENFGDTSHLALIQTTFNPITGYMYMGLENDAAIKYATKFAQNKAKQEGKDPKKTSPVYSKEVIEGLINEGLIISTGSLIDNEFIRNAFDANYFDISWKDDYINSAKKFWESIGQMKDVVLPIYMRTLKDLYPELSNMSKSAQRELEERAMLLLANSFNGYLHNRDHVESEYLKMSDKKYEEQEHYEYDEHREQGIKVSKGGHPVYDIAMFVINSKDLDNMPGKIEFASGIVRNNRIEGNITDSSGSFSSKEEFVAAPVPVVMQEIVSEELTESDWKALHKIDWSDLKDEIWEDSHKFGKYMKKKGNISNAIASAIENLRQNMIRVYDKNAATSAHLIDQYKVILPIICGPDRETHAVIPFVKLGY